MNNTPSIAIIIPSLNSARTIGACLDGILMLDYPKEQYHIIIIDHGSSDETEHIASSLGAEFHSYPNAKSIGELRNRGVEISKSEFLAFIDSDCIPNREWLSNAITTINDNDINITGFDYLISNDPTWIEKLWYDMRRLDVQKEDIVIPAGNFIIRRSTFLDVGGFDINLLSGEDTDICLRLIENNNRIIADPSIKVVHLNEPKTLGQLFRKQVWHGSGMFKVLLKHFDIRVAKIPLFSTLYFLGILMSIFLTVSGYYAAAILFSILIILCFPLILSLTKCLEGKHRNILGGTLLYIIYFFARSYSIVKYKLFGDIFRIIGRLFTRGV